MCTVSVTNKINQLTLNFLKSSFPFSGREHRERDLHEAYRNARTPKEASAVLQHYAQRFTISEAILERLKLNKLLERSVSADPNRHSSLADCPNMSSNLLQCLRQQSLPAPKFTSTVEARVTGFMGDVENVVGPAYSLDPIQYRQSRNGSAGTDKVRTAAGSTFFLITDIFRNKRIRDKSCNL